MDYIEKKILETNNINGEIEIVKLTNAIQMLKKYIDDSSIDPLISVLEAMTLDPNNESYLKQLKEIVNSLGIIQGAVLTYAPYINAIVEDDPFGEIS